MCPDNTPVVEHLRNGELLLEVDASLFLLG